MKRKLWLRTMFGLLALAGCGSDSMQVGTIPPADIKDLMVSALTESTIALTWTAPPDLPEQSVAFSYDFRYAQADLSQDWEAGTKVTSLGKPQEPGTEEMITVEGLARSERYSFGLRTTDKLGNESRTSNVVWAEPMDVTAPGQITDLSAEVLTSTQVALTWTATGDDGGTGRATRYEARYFTEELTEANWGKAVSFKVVDPPALAGNPDQYTVEELEALTTYWFGVRAIDDGLNVGLLSNVVTVTMLRSPITWTVKEDGSGDAPTVQAGIDLAIDGDEVLVGPGRYVENIDFKGKSLFLRSEQGRDVTVLDGSGSPGGDSVITLSAEESVTIEGFTITGGEGRPDATGGDRRGGGIYSESGKLQVLGNAFKRNTAIGTIGGVGGAIFLGSAEKQTGFLFAEANVFFENEALRLGGAICLWHIAGAFIQENSFEQNRTEHDGGGICYLTTDQSPIEVSENAFVENHAGDHGGGVYVAGAGRTTPIRIVSNLMVRNLALGEPPGPNGAGGAIYVVRVSGSIANNTLVANGGSGQLPCAGGGIFIDLDVTDLKIRNNIIAWSDGCGLGCVEGSTPLIQNNIVWANDSDFGLGDRACVDVGVNILADPQFCNSKNSDYRVSAGSPALIGKEVIGAFRKPGCN